ncbi:hypothetical protein HK103_002374 [Boothiomyces macroporosus]|uniref:F-box domain-containing protein n=1 Tax=Boothiomyces macroporosus TaxID=261099 RepID=A0AAD5UAB7_9FUNG|nr:hypothetical protein HK103_002374 [Boothiomyces macroporosus]
MLTKLPFHVFENRIFYYLNGQDLYNISMANKELRNRMKPLQTLAKFRVKPLDIWPVLHSSFKGEFPTDAALSTPELLEALSEISKIEWTFPVIAVDSPNYPVLYNYLPKANSVHVTVTDKDNTAELSNAFERDMVTHLTIRSENGISAERMDAILSNLNKMSQLVELNILGKASTCPAVSLQIYLPQSNVEFLNIVYSTVNSDDISTLATALPTTKIKELDLHANMVGDAGSLALASVLPKTEIEWLNLSNNQIGIEGIKALAAALPHCKLKTLDLSGNGLFGSRLDEILKVIHLSKLETLEIFDYTDSTTMDLLNKNLPLSNLKSLVLGMESEYIPDFLKAASETKLEDLTIHTSDGDSIAIKIAENIHYFKVRRFALHNASLLLHDAAERFIQSLKETDLEELDLHENPFGNHGLIELGKVLPFTNIKKLIVYACEHSDRGLLEFSKYIKDSKLEHLDVSSDVISGSGVLKFLQNLNPSLRYLRIQHNWNIDKEASLQIAQVVRNYPSVKFDY